MFTPHHFLASREFRISTLNKYNVQFNKDVPIKSEAGFTLFELLIVLAILGLIAAGGMAVSLNMFKAYFFKNEYSTAVRLLEQARSSSLSNNDNAVHGVRFEDNKYITFRGDYDPNNNLNLVFPQSSELHPEQTSEFIFQRLTGKAQNNQTVKLIDGAYSKNISINQAGRIEVQ